MSEIQPAKVSEQASQPQPIQQIPLPLENNNIVKRYVFNETGNIMIIWVGMDTDKIPVNVSALFNEVSVFFVAMLKKISGTINPVSNKPFSIYDYNAIMSVINESGLFVKLTSEEITYKSSSYGVNYCKQLIERLLGLPHTLDGLSFAQPMITSIGKEGLRLVGENNASDSKVANIIFICEYLLGVPTVSAIVVSCDAKMNSQIFKIGPCSKETTTSTSLTMKKDTYMFAITKLETQSSN